MGREGGRVVKLDDWGCLMDGGSLVEEKGGGGLSTLLYTPRRDQIRFLASRYEMSN